MIPVPDSAPLARRGGDVLDRAKALVVTNADEHLRGNEEGKKVKTLIRDIEAAFKEPKQKAHEAHRAITKLEGDLLGLPKEALRLIDGKLSAYEIERDRRIREEQLRLQAEERARADEAKLNQAVALVDAGEPEAADSLLDAPTVATVVELEIPKVQGVSTRPNWVPEMVDESKIKRAFLTPDFAKIRQTVRAMGKDAEALIGGIRVVEDRVRSYRR